MRAQLEFEDLFASLGIYWASDLYIILTCIFDDAISLCETLAMTYAIFKLFCGIDKGKF